ncbi:hypothetical protein B0T26DRAFT_157982 [Lasiosphaeria miniovina]|uniref:Uncharacterized protein n=1 Tax=Lasiosphaeria miniovina TaxID=1954250 RepID=A0AA40B5J1_9PEZI|nr:uncharacterized protein B0T26DRAFT_157982 [Lasiosphaeria miniovina]KAK0728099.1 hypothetical protein B0T26DRAFT_157982 [Lasiosphaeria miniovina]
MSPGTERPGLPLSICLPFPDHPPEGNENEPKHFCTGRATPQPWRIGACDPIHSTPPPLDHPPAHKNTNGGRLGTLKLPYALPSRFLPGYLP